MQACPTGALMPARGAGLAKIDREVESVCPYCGVGCQTTAYVKDNKIVAIDGQKTSNRQLEDITTDKLRAALNSLGVRR